MKFVRLDLLAYGPFTNHRLSFPAGGADFHIVYGPNEAGKSTTRRAISGLLYGIESRTGDAHLHPASELRIGATVQNGKGEERTFVRRKGNQATLLDEKGAVVDEARLRAWLSIYDRNHFEQMFGLGHEQLREAGEALSNAKTDVGRMLFGALLDGTTLHQTLVRLDSEAEKLLSPGGNAGAITKALVAYREHHKRAKELTVQPKEWQALHDEFEAAQAKSEEVSADIVRARTERHRLKRLQEALPWLRQRGDALQRLDAMGTVRMLPSDIDTQRRELAHALETAETNHRRVEAEVSRTRRECDGLRLPEALLAAGTRVRQLSEDLGSYKDELEAVPRVTQEIVAFRSEQRELLRQIGHGDVSTKAVGTLRVDEASLERVRVLERRGLTLQARLGDLRARAAQQRLLTSQHEAALATLPPAVDTAVLHAAWEHLRPDKALAHTIRDAEARVATHDASVKAACAALAPWSGPPDAAPALPVPSEDVIRAFDAEFIDHARASKDLSEQIVARTRALDGVRRRLADLRAAGEPPSERRLLEARARRDQGWEHVRRAWASGLSLSAIDDEFASDVPLVAAYAAAAQVADELSDELRRKSGRAAEYAALQRDEAVKQAELDAVAREQASVAANAQQRQEAWRQQWLACGVSPASPREMLAWRGRHVALLEALRRRDEAAAQAESHRSTMREHQRELLSALERAGAPMPDGTPWLTLLLHVEQTLKLAREQGAARASLSKDVLSGQREVATLETQSRDCEQEVMAWREEWGGAVAKLRLSPDALPEEANVVLTKLSELARLEDKCERQEYRLKAIQTKGGRFEEAVKALVVEFDLDLAGTALDLANGLIARHGEATKAAERRRMLVEQLTKYERDLDEARITLEAEQRRLGAMLLQSGCSDVAELEGAIERSTRARELEGLRAEAEKRLAEVGEGWSLESLERAAAETDSDRVEAEVAALDERLKALGAMQRDQAEKVGALRERKKKFGGAGDAAGALAEAHEHLALARSHADQYARLRLATALLRRGVENYRQKNEGAILQRASRLFECLTLGRYQRLSVVHEGEKVRLRCMRGSKPVEVEPGLSDGTLDQLYLSLRLASLEQHLESQEPMPLVLDDIFIHFDDDRATAGLRVLSEFAQRTQVLLLTHHARNLDLARAALKEGSWAEHRLPTSAGAAAGT